MHLAAEAAGLRRVPFRDLRHIDSILFAQLVYPVEDEAECPEVMELLVAAVSVVRVLPNSIEISYCEMTYIARFEPLEDVP